MIVAGQLRRTVWALCAVAALGANVSSLVYALASLDTPYGLAAAGWRLTLGARSCGVADEGSTLELGCAAPGAVITSVAFASYGMPTGACDDGNDSSALTADPACDADKDAVLAIAAAACVGARNCSFFASTDALGVDDPCFGTPKSLAVAVTCGDGGVAAALGASVASAAFKYHVHVIHSPMIKPLHTEMLQPVLDIFRSDSRIDFTPSSYLDYSDDHTSWCQAHGKPLVMGTTFSHRRAWAQIAQCAPDEPCRHPLQLRGEGSVCSSWNASRCAAAPASFNIEGCYSLEREHHHARDDAWSRKWTSLGCESLINTNGPWHIILEDDVALPGSISSADVRKLIDEELAASERLLYYLGTVGRKKWFGLHAYAVRGAERCRRALAALQRQRHEN